MSRLQYEVATTFLLPSFKPGRDTKTRSRSSWRLPYVATSISCRDLVSAHSGISRSRRQKPGRDLPHCYPCRDLKNDVTTSTQLSPIFATSRRPFSMSQPPLLPPMSRPQNDVATSIPTGQNPRSSILRPTATQPGNDATSWSRPHVQPNQVVTSNPCRDLNKSQPTTTFFFFQNQPVAFLPSTSLMQ